MKWALVDGSGVIQNVIEYDGVSAYEPHENLSLQQVNEWVNTGDNKDIAEPVYVIPIPPVPPTKDDLLQQLNAISDKINALGS